jgi:hypothetical protein
MAAKLAHIQNKCLRVVAGAYCATVTHTLEVETHVPPMDLYLDSRLAAFQNMLANLEAGQLIEKACSTIQARIRNRRRRRITRKITAREQRREWVEKRAEWIQQNKPNTPNKVRKAEGPQGLEIKMACTGSTETITGLLGSNQVTLLQLHKHLRKAESTMLVQLRTGRTVLRHFLSKAQVPGYESEEYSCGTGP